MPLRPSPARSPACRVWFQPTGDIWRRSPTPSPPKTRPESPAEASLLQRGSAREEISRDHGPPRRWHVSTHPPTREGPPAGGPFLTSCTGRFSLRGIAPVYEVVDRKSTRLNSSHV